MIYQVLCLNKIAPVDMILVDIREYLKLSKTANLLAMAKHFEVDPELVRDMLNVWVAKGKVKKCAQLPGCGTKCTKCNPMLTEQYQWIV